MTAQEEKETVNWVKGLTGLIITKIAFCNHITNTWKRDLMSWAEDEIENLPDLLKLNERIYGGKHRWKTVSKGPSSEIRKLFTKKPYVEYFYKTCYICEKRNCPFERNRHDIPLFKEEKTPQKDHDLGQKANTHMTREEKKTSIIDQYYWQIAIMTMFRGKERYDIPNMRPEDSGSELIFKMLKNCELFDLGIDEYVYDRLISFRERLINTDYHHLSDKYLDESFDHMKTLLNAEQFSDDECCKLALIELSKLKDLVIVLSPISFNDKKLIHRAFTEQQRALEYDISVKGWCREGTLEISKQKSASGNYISQLARSLWDHTFYRNSKQTSDTCSDSEQSRQASNTALIYAEKETANWTKATTGLVITKIALCNHIINTWESELKSWQHDEIEHLPHLLQDIQEDRFDFLNKERNKHTGKIWKINCKCPSMLCEGIFDHLRECHGHDSKKTVWNPISKDPPSKRRQLFLKKVQEVSKQNYVRYFDKICYICRERNCPFERSRNGVPLFEEKTTTVDQNYWQIANMFMFRGKERNVIPNTGPEDTDAALIFKMMKNCKLFDLGNDEYDEVYDDLLEVRNFLMHNANQRLSDEALDECFDRMETLLNAEQFRDDEYCKQALEELSKLKDLVIFMSLLGPEDKNLVHKAFTEQQGSLKYDISVGGSLKNSSDLESILKVSEQKSASGKYCDSQVKSESKDSETDQTQENNQSEEAKKESKDSETDQTQENNQSEEAKKESKDNYSQTETKKPENSKKKTVLAVAAAGVATGAAVGTVGGPIGAAIGGVSGGIIGLAQSIKRIK